MGNADPRMLALGLPVLPTNDEDGVAQAVERYVLEPRPIPETREGVNSSPLQAWLTAADYFFLAAFFFGAAFFAFFMGIVLIPLRPE